jgi:hypothetical protein
MDVKANSTNHRAVSPTRDIHGPNTDISQNPLGHESGSIRFEPRHTHATAFRLRSMRRCRDNRKDSAENRGKLWREGIEERMSKPLASRDPFGAGVSTYRTPIRPRKEIQPNTEKSIVSRAPARFRRNLITQLTNCMTIC